MKAEKLAYQTYSPSCRKLAEAKLQRLLFCGVNSPFHPLMFPAWPLDLEIFFK